MSDLQQRISEAALQALRVGHDNHVRVIESFRERVYPTKVHLPSRPTPGDLAHIYHLIKLTAFKATVLNGVKTQGFPSVIALGKTNDQATVGCTGFLVSSDMVLTAGHCIAKGFTGRAWIQDLEGNPRPLEFLKIEKHEFFGKPEEFANDIGLLRLSEPVEGIDIYDIADNATLDAAAAFRIVGFGKDEKGAFGLSNKKTVIVSRLSPDDNSVGFEGFEFFIGDATVDDDGDACPGDSGGPVFIDVGGVLRLGGLISRKVPSDQVCGDGTICVRLSRYVDWIDKIIEELGGKPRT